MANVTRVAGNGLWQDAASWTGGVRPSGVDVAVLNAAGTTSFAQQGIPEVAGLTIGASAKLVVDWSFQVGTSGQGSTQMYSLTNAGILEINNGSLTVGNRVTSATGDVVVKGYGSYVWNGSGSSQQVLLDGFGTTFQFATDFGGTVKGWGQGEFIRLSNNAGGATSIEIGTNLITFYQGSRAYQVKLSSDYGVTYNSSNVQVVQSEYGPYVSTLVNTDGTYTPPVVPAKVLLVSSPTADGSYKADAEISVTVKFDKAVTVTGTPTLTLETGATDRAAVYASGSGSDTLTFKYVVQAGDVSADLNYVGTGSLTFNGGSIKDASGVAVTRTLPSLAGTGSLATNKAIVVDTQAPDKPVLSLVQDTGAPGDNYTSNGAFGVSSEAGARVQYLSNGAWVSDRPATSQDGDYTIIARQIDAAGNISAASDAFTFTVDTKSPSKLVVALLNDTGKPGDSLTSSSAVKVSGNEDGATVQFSTDQKTWSAAQPALADGAHEVYVRQVDKAGNASESASIAFTLDKTAPQSPTLALVSDTGKIGDGITRDARIVPGNTEANATLEYSVDGGDWLASLPELTDGGYSIRARQTDVSGNTSPASAALVITVDKTAPVAPTLALANDTGRPGDLVTNEAKLVIGGREAGSKIEFSADLGKTWADSPANFVEGSNTVAIRQTDVAGNVSGQSSLTFNLDTVGPTAQISGPKDTVGYGKTGAVTLLFNEAVTGLELSDLVITGGTASDLKATGAASYQVTFTPTKNFFGTASVELKGSYEDIAGNSGAASKAVPFTVDAREPDDAAPVRPSPNPGNNPTPNDDFNEAQAALAITLFFEGAAPNAARLASLSAFAELQYQAYGAKGVMNPALGAFEALGRGFSEAASFAAKYGMQSEADFIAGRYLEVFGRGATAAQQSHFQAQIDYFEAIYEGVGIPSPQADLFAKGAILGQMIGYSTLGLF